MRFFVFFIYFYKMKLKTLTLFFILFCHFHVVQAQLGFCTGTKGDPIFTENFGSGLDFGPALNPGITSYTFINGTPNDGQYTLHYRTNLYSSWHNSLDHTPDTDVNGYNGKSLIVNASIAPNYFFKKVVTNLCVNTTFEFSAWLMNVYNAASVGACSGTGIPINVTFEIWDETETTLLQSGNTNAIQGTNAPIWTQYGLVFTTASNQTSVVLKMRNNGAGGCGNDLAIDDIMFRSCGDLAQIKTAGVNSNFMNICQNQLPNDIQLQVEINNPNNHVYQWQKSNDAINWTAISGANSTTYWVTNFSTTTYYRVKIAQDISNLNNDFCSTVTPEFGIHIISIPNAPTSLGNKTYCINEINKSIAVSVNTNETTNWYGSPTGNDLVLANSNVLTPSSSGTYYAEAKNINSLCISNTRTPVTIQLVDVPQLGANQNVLICPNESLLLTVNEENATYLWSNAATTPSIFVNQAGAYTVTVTIANNCSSTKTFFVTQSVVPKIAQVITEFSTVTIICENQGPFEYSLDGIHFQNSNTFYNVSGGLKKAYVRTTNSCNIPDVKAFVLVQIPNFFSPNNDGINDFFEIENAQDFRNFHFYIFDRYGKLIQKLSTSNSRWDGKYLGLDLPAADYWYSANFEDTIQISGHFSILR
ncbi:T9SS type B sorting domain-containing protein [Flavobacterium branchiophilum]